MLPVVRTSRALAWLRRWWPDLVGGLVALVYALPSLWYPFSKDQPIHWYIAERLLEGELPYVSALSTKAPGVFALLAGAQAVFGDSMVTVRIVDVLFIAIGGWLVATFRRQATLPGATIERPQRVPGELGAAWVLAATFHYTFFDFSDTGHPELWQGVLMLSSVWIVARAPDLRISPRRAFAAGAMAMAAVTFKHVAFVTGVLAGALIVVLALRRESPEPRRALRNAALFTAAVGGVLGLTVLPWALAGHFDVLWETMVTFILDYAGKSVGGHHRGPPPFLTYDHGLFAFVAALAALYAGLATTFANRHRRERAVGWIVLLTFATAFVSVAVQKRGFVSFVWTYYFVTMVPFLALAAGWGLRVQLPRRGVAQLGVAVALMAAFFCYQPAGTHQSQHSYLDEHASFWPFLIGRRTATDHHAPHRDGPLEDYNRLRRVADYVTSRARPGDTLCLDGWIMMVYQMTKLRCPSRFLYGDGPNRRPEWVAEYREMLAREPPTFFVTFGLRPRVRQLVRRGYSRHDIRFEDAWYTVLEAPRDP